MQVVTSRQMKQIEQNSLAYDLTYHRLMENAGSAAAAFIRRTFKVQGLNCMIFCAKGNNGGDGLVVARKLSENGANVVIVMLDGIPRTQEAAAMYQTALMMDLPMVDFSSETKKVTDFLQQTDIVVDAICGTGFSGSLQGPHRQACQAINAAIAAVISLDIPTGVECDTGAADPDAVKADFTVTFDSQKPVHILPQSSPYCGTIEVVDIGIPVQAHQGIGPYFELPAPGTESSFPAFSFEPASPAEAPDELPAAEGDLSLEFSFVGEEPAPESEFVFAPVEPELIQPQPVAAVSQAAEEIQTPWVLQQLPPRTGDSHKGTYGKLLLIAGSQNYRGAATLATLAALRSGVGLATLASTAEVCSATASHVLEATYLPLAQSAVGGIDYEASSSLLEKQLSLCDAIVFGCGLGNTVHTARLLTLVLEQSSCPVLVDADGINALAENIHVLHKASAPVIVTPHAGEMSRLCGVPVEELQQDRQGFADRFAQEHGITVVLKGPGTLIASPFDRTLQNTTGNSGLAKGGSGDLLSGMIGAFLAQGIPVHESCACAVHLHGLAADRCAARRSRYAMLPSEILEDLSCIFLENGR